MGVHRLASRCVGSLLCAASFASASLAGAQPPPSPSPGPQANRDAAIIAPLVEIGRVRARTPYCAALARTRLGVDAAITYQYALPTVYRDLRGFRLDSYLTKHLSLREDRARSQRCWSWRRPGATQVKALRAAASWPTASTKARRTEMLGFANALDGAKARQMLLAKSRAAGRARRSADPRHRQHRLRRPRRFVLPALARRGMGPADAVPTVQPCTRARRPTRLRITTGSRRCSARSARSASSATTSRMPHAT